MPASCTRLWVVLGLAAIFLPVDVANEECTFATMTARHGDWPVDLAPPFRHDIFTYAAKLDFSMNFFSIDARPSSGCETAHPPPQKTFVQIGGSVTVTLYAKNPETSAKRAYTVTASRVLGSETELQFLTVVGGEFSPIFNPTQRTYHVRLDLKYDVARVVYRLADNMQRLSSSAQEEEPTSAEAATTAAAKTPVKAERRPEQENGKKTEGGSEESSQKETPERRMLQINTVTNDTLLAEPMERRLGATVKEPLRTSGEAQFRDAYESFMLDVGFKRKIVLVVQCADATQASIGAYTLIVHRPGCTPQLPYFEPRRRQCVNFCPAGFYRNEETHRCSQCNTNCRVCDSLLHCQSCVPDTATYSYIAQPDGRCEAVVNHLYEKYRWWCIGLAVLLSFLVLIGCIGICQLCGCCGEAVETRKRQVHTYESEEEDEEGQHPPYGARRRLAAY